MVEIKSEPTWWKNHFRIKFIPDQTNRSRPLVLAWTVPVRAWVANPSEGKIWNKFHGSRIGHRSPLDPNSCEHIDGSRYSHMPAAVNEHFFAEKCISSSLERSNPKGSRADMEERSKKGTNAGKASLIGSILLPLALAQFVCSYAGSNMNVAINSIVIDLGTTVHGVQIAITLFTLTMAALMLPGSKLTDIWGRKRTFQIGLILYGLGALVGALAPGISFLYIGYSIMEGVGSALLIPPVYILATVNYTTTESRAKAFGTIAAAGGIGAALGPLVGGFLTTAITWRASFILQAIIVLLIILMARRIVQSGHPRDQTQAGHSGGISIGRWTVLPGHRDPHNRNLRLVLRSGLDTCIDRGYHRRSLLLPHPVHGTKGEGAADSDPYIPKSHLQSWSCDAVRSMDHPAGVILHRFGLLPDDPRVQCHRGRPDTHPCNDRDPADRRQGKKAGNEDDPEEVNCHRLRFDHGGHAPCPAFTNSHRHRGHGERLDLCSWPILDGAWVRHHDHLLRQHACSIGVPGEGPGRDIRPVKEHFQSGFVGRHGGGRIDPRHDGRFADPDLRAGADRDHLHFDRRSGGGDAHPPRSRGKIEKRGRGG